MYYINPDQWQLPEQDTNPITYRLSNEHDKPFIYASWLSSEKNNTPAYLTPKLTYQQEQTKKIDYLLTKSQTFMALLDPLRDEPDVLIAYLTYQYLNDHLIVHYAFTKSSYRQLHFQSKMLELINPLNQPIILTCQPDKKILTNLQKKHQIFYDHFYFQRNFYV
jgi:hypothetical protein